jgi:hypothetical protein
MSDDTGNDELRSKSGFWAWTREPDPDDFVFG